MTKKLVLGLWLVTCIFSTSVAAAPIQKMIEIQEDSILLIKNFGDYIDIRIPVELDVKMDSDWNSYMSFKAPLDKMKTYLTNQLHKDIRNSKINSVYFSNASTHDFYVTQRNTGQYAKVNCLAASAASIVKWINPASVWTVEDIRNKVRPQGGLLYTNEIESFFNELSLEYDVAYIPEDDLSYAYSELVSMLNSGSIIMTCADMNEISYDYTKNQRKLGKGYYNDFKHSYLITGYVIVEDNLYFEVFDPYDDVVEKRFMEAEEVVDSITEHWGSVFEVPYQYSGTSK